MTHAELKVLFLKYHQEAWPERRCFENRTGVAKYKYKGHTQYVAYGLPLPKAGKLKKVGGGGPDLLSIGIENGYHTIWYFEIKCIGDKLRYNQKIFKNWAVKSGANYYIVKENKERDGFDIIKL